jgi:ribosomal protein L29
MALLKQRDVVNMNKDEIISRLKELKIELSRAHVTAHKTSAKTKELKKAIARLMTRATSLKQQQGGALK